jgi:TRAP-type C4-dicarboxylate transport system permease small subunit
MILLASAQILLRNVAETGLVWADPVLRVLVLWVGMLAALVASRTDNHISVDVLSRLLRGRPKVAVQAGTCLFTAGVCALLAYHAGRFVVSEWEARTEAFLGVPAWIFELILPLAFGLIAVRYALLCAQRLRGVLAARDPA